MQLINDLGSIGRERFRTMTLAPDAFISRFLVHVLPKGFHRIRHYGLLASAACKANIARVRELIAGPAPVIDPPAGRDNRRRPSPAMSLLRRPHNHRRHLRARGRTPWPPCRAARHWSLAGSSHQDTRAA
jgi:hypothetical protein